MKFKVYRARRGLLRRNQWRWTLYADNHKKVANSGEGYTNRIDCLSTIAAIIGLPADTKVEVQP